MRMKPPYAAISACSAASAFCAVVSPTCAPASASPIANRMAMLYFSSNFASASRELGNHVARRVARRPAELLPKPVNTATKARMSPLPRSRGTPEPVVQPPRLGLSLRVKIPVPPCPSRRRSMPVRASLPCPSRFCTTRSVPVVNASSTSAAPHIARRERPPRAPRARRARRPLSPRNVRRRARATRIHDRYAPGGAETAGTGQRCAHGHRTPPAGTRRYWDLDA
mmetsp:Transcript_1576/g.6229  ORF Transcript_1576/g.6229 Transcript_1576/m.6229 type:complete len:225 (+) Transcript_1576:1410-2084(+)